MGLFGKTKPKDPKEEVLDSRLNDTSYGAHEVPVLVQAQPENGNMGFPSKVKPRPPPTAKKSLSFGLFGCRVQKWTSAIRKEGYKIDRSVANIKREEDKVTRSLKEAAKKGQMDVCKILAKEIMSSRKAQSKLHAAKAHMNSIQMQMKNQLAVLRISGALESSTAVMQSMQQLVKVEDISATMRELSQEMMKAGIIEEMVDDTLEDALGDDDELEEDAAEEVDKVLFELTSGVIGKAPAAHTETLPVPETPEVPASDEEEEDMEAMRERLQALRS